MTRRSRFDVNAKNHAVRGKSNNALLLVLNRGASLVRRHGAGAREAGGRRPGGRVETRGRGAIDAVARLSRGRRRRRAHAGPRARDERRHGEPGARARGPRVHPSRGRGRRGGEGDCARARAAERASARAEAERYAAAADALAAETRARVADDFAPLVGELSRARFFRDDDGDPVAFSRIAGTADDADDARETHVSAASHAREDLLASVRRRDDGVVVEHADLSPRSSSAAEGVAEPRTRPPPAETSAPLAIGQTTY